MGVWGMGTPVEIEFALNFPKIEKNIVEFALLQMRPLVIHREPEEYLVETKDRSTILCQSDQVLGHGII
jgi:hypothetical protein